MNNPCPENKEAKEIKEFIEDGEKLFYERPKEQSNLTEAQDAQQIKEGEKTVESVNQLQESFNSLCEMLKVIVKVHEEVKEASYNMTKRIDEMSEKKEHREVEE